MTPYEVMGFIWKIQVPVEAAGCAHGAVKSTVVVGDASRLRLLDIEVACVLA